MNGLYRGDPDWGLIGTTTHGSFFVPERYEEQNGLVVKGGPDMGDSPPWKEPAGGWLTAAG